MPAGRVQPEVDHLVARLYDWLLVEVAGRGCEPAATSTRMKALHAEGTYRESHRSYRRVVVVDVARAGDLPAHRFYQGLCCALTPKTSGRIVAASRTTDEWRRSRVSLDGSRSWPVWTPPCSFRPHGRDGNGLGGVIRHYQDADEGAPRKVVAVHLIVTLSTSRGWQETSTASDHGIRLDRGLSSPEVLQTRPGERWSEESGLNERQYIVPGAGGVGGAEQRLGLTQRRE